MAVSKKVAFGEGKYYFTVDSGYQQVTIHRDSRFEASSRFMFYKRIGKECEWLGCWNGKRFDDDVPPGGKNGS